MIVDGGLKNINIFHTGRGNEFKNQMIEETLEAFEVTRSLSHKGCLYDNAVVEATFKNIKTEFVKNQTFMNLDTLKLQLADYVNWFNHHRIHSPLGYLTPVEYRMNNLKKLFGLLLTIHITKNCSQCQVKNGDILLTYIVLLSMGKPQFFPPMKWMMIKIFFYALGITREILSEETLYQRMDDIGSSLRNLILKETISMLKANGIHPGKLKNGFVPVDIYVSPFDNSKFKKEGVSRTYKGYDICAPIMAYIGTEEYLINAQLREVSNIASVILSSF